MKKLFVWIYVLPFLLTACQEDQFLPGVETQGLTPAQQALIGRAVKFEPYMSDFLSTRAITYNDHTGAFNTNDVLYIYRQEYINKQWVYANPPVAVYSFQGQGNGSTGIIDKYSWKIKAGMPVSFRDENYTNPDPNTWRGDDVHTYSKILTAADSIVWMSGNNMRFRAWAVSRLGNDLDKTPEQAGYANAIKYPDYSVCDWVSVSGPMESVPMSMTHLGCRLDFYAVNQNSFAKRIEISTDPADYRRNDNADTPENDEQDKHPETSEDGSVLTAAQCAANVAAVKDLMCWPAGVAVSNMSLMAVGTATIPSTYLPHASELTTAFIKEKNDDGTYKNVKHAEFAAYIDHHGYMITVPYDMSCDGEHKGEPLKLPPYTRFRIWLSDVNNGDEANTGAESSYHIFRLSDARKEKSDEPAFPDGITLRPGYSFQFQVGYRYGQLTVTAADSFSWEEQNQVEALATDEVVADTPTEQPYQWWKDAIVTAIQNASKEGHDYDPEFHISTTEQFKEFINLVNGTGYKTDRPFLKAHRYNTTTKKNEVWWYTQINAPRDTVWVTNPEEKEGYLFYERYYPSKGDQAAYSEEDYLTTPYSFFDESVRRSFKVYLENDIDLHDWLLDNIGSITTLNGSNEPTGNPFWGYFNGQGHVLSNVYLKGNGQLFSYVKEGVISNLQIETTHPFSLTGTCYKSRLVGCAVYAPSTDAALAQYAIGQCYFIGCMHKGNTTLPLINNVDDQSMVYGCLQVARGIEKGALVGIASSQAKNYFASQGAETELDKISWSNFACNYFDTDLSPNAGAVTLHNGTKYTEKYNRRQYIRGVTTHVLAALNDFLIDVNTSWKKLTAGKPMREMEYYGVAPWRALNCGIAKYNAGNGTDYLRCEMHYEVPAEGFRNNHPLLKPQAPTSTQWDEVMDKYN